MLLFAFLISLQSYSCLAEQQQQGGLLQFPLIPHHAITERYLQESPNDSSVKNKKKHRYDHLHHATEIYQGYGAHYIEMYVGSPPQRMTVIVDTGSSGIAFPCNGCPDCGQNSHTDIQFNQNASSTFEIVTCDQCLKGACPNPNDPNPCKMYVTYAEGSSWSAIEVSDEVIFDHHRQKKLAPANKREWPFVTTPAAKILSDRSNFETLTDLHLPTSTWKEEPAPFRLKFGCQTEVSGQFKKQLADGIVGMSNSRSSFWSQLHRQDMMKEKKFSLCYVKNPIPHPNGSKAGCVTFGGADNRLHNDHMVYAESIQNNQFFGVSLQNIYVIPTGGEFLTGEKANIHLSKRGAKKLDISKDEMNKEMFVVDSGTTNVYLNQEIQKALNVVWVEIMGYPFPTSAVSAKGDEIRKWPTIILQLKGSAELVGDETYDTDDIYSVPNKAAVINPRNKDDVLIAFPPSHYMDYDKRQGKYFPRLGFTEDGKQTNGPILGAAIMQGHDIMYDIDNARIGIAESDCDFHYLTTGERGVPFDPLNVPNDIRRFVKENMCSSRQCKIHILGALALSVIFCFICGWKVLIGQTKERHIVLLNHSGEESDLE